MPISANLLKHLGLVGPDSFASGIIPRAATPAALQAQANEFRDGGLVDNPDIWSSYGGVMRTPKSLEEMYKLWEEMAGWDLMAAALKEFTEEAVQVDSTSPASLWYECNDPAVEDELNDLAAKLDIETRLPSQVWHVAALGNNFEKLDYAVNDGVTGMSFVHPFDIRRYWLSRNRHCIGFRWQGHTPNRESVWAGLDNKTPVERVGINDGKGQIEDLWYPWDVLHTRRMFRNRASEHGEPVFDEAVGIYKKLRIALDQMVVHRAQVQPDRYAINIDTQEQPPTDQMRTVQRWKQAMRSKLSFGSGGPDDFVKPQDFKAFYNPLALDTILWVARPKGFQHSIEKLGGTQVIPDVFDVELLIELFFSIIGVPKSWFGLNKDGSQAQSGKALLAQDVRFLRKVKSIRRPLVTSYTWLAYFHCLLRGKRVDELEIKAKMPEIGSLEDQMKLEILEKQASVLQILGEVMTTYNLPKEAWVEVIFKRYMHLPDDVVNVFLTALPADAVPEGVKDAPRTSKLIQEIIGHLGSNVERVEELKRLVRKRDSFKRAESKVVKFNKLSLPTIVDGDVIIGSNVDAETFKVKLEGAKTSASNQKANHSEPSPTVLQEDSTLGNSRRTGGWHRFYQNL